jgi:hypothetical protein
MRSLSDMRLLRRSLACVLLAISGVFSNTAYADAEVLSADTADFGGLWQSAPRWSLELNATRLGRYGEEELSAPGFSSGAASSNLGLDAALRRQISEDFSAGFRLSLYSRIEGYRRDGLKTEAYISPWMWAFRYEKASFFGQSFFVPWVEAEAGMTVIQFAGKHLEESHWSLSARGSLGFNLSPFASRKFFVSARSSYLVVRHFSNVQLGTGFGVSF